MVPRPWLQLSPKEVPMSQAPEELDFPVEDDGLEDGVDPVATDQDDPAFSAGDQ